MAENIIRGKETVIVVQTGDMGGSHHRREREGERQPKNMG
jgi:hypothetical protein